MSPNWREVWGDRRISERIDAEECLDAYLLRADGYDTPFGRVEPEAWLRSVDQILQQLKLRPGHSIFEIGCGAGAFLIEPWRRGHQVGGIDLSPELIDLARAVIPDGRFQVADAEHFTASEPWHTVVACGVMMYLGSTEKAENIITKMASTAQRSIALLDLPDLAFKDEAEAFRRASLTEEAYRERYTGLDHLYFDRNRIREVLLGLGFDEVVIADQAIEGYRNGAFRFNALASHRSGPSPV